MNVSAAQMGNKQKAFLASSALIVITTVLVFVVWFRGFPEDDGHRLIPRAGQWRVRLFLPPHPERQVGIRVDDCPADARLSLAATHIAPARKLQPVAPGRWLVEGLLPLTSYQFTLRAPSRPRHRFRATTAPPRGRSIRFCAYGESRHGHTVHETLLRAICKRRPAFTVHLGNFVANGSNEQAWTNGLLRILPLARCLPFIAIMGRHEAPATAFCRHAIGHRQRSSFVVDAGLVRLIGLPTEMEVEAMVRLLKTAFSSRPPSSRWTVIAMHEPPWGVIVPAVSASVQRRDLRSRFEAAIEGEKVDLVLAGYDRLYAHRVHGSTHYVISGGGGTALDQGSTNGECQWKTVHAQHHYLEIDARSYVLKVSAYGLDDTVLDAFEITKR